MEQKLKKTLNNISKEYEFTDIVNLPSRKRNQSWFNKWNVNIAATLVLFGVIYLFVPQVSSMTNKWISQTFYISTEDNFEIKNGYVYINEIKTIPVEEYELGLYQPIYNGEEYVLEKMQNTKLILDKITKEG